MIGKQIFLEILEYLYDVKFLEGKKFKINEIKWAYQGLLNDRNMKNIEETFLSLECFNIMTKDKWKGELW